jgi:putative ABC transport system substrate-binding protein
VGDPIASGIVARLDRPSGNITGFAIWEATLGGKWLQLLSEIAPGLKRAAFMFNPDINPFSPYLPVQQQPIFASSLNTLVDPGDAIA